MSESPDSYATPDAPEAGSAVQTARPAVADAPFPNTRPAVASRRARQGQKTRNVTRYTLDLEKNQHQFLRLFAISNECDASKVMRTLLYLLEADDTLANRVLDELFGEEDAPSADLADGGDGA